MRELRLVGLSGDRMHLVLRGDTGEEFRVLADERLRAYLRGDRARLGQLENEMDSALRPRDIQARIRAGSSPEDVAAVAKVPVERIMGYAVPVLAEREHIADQAQRSTVRRRHTQGPTRLLGEVVGQQLHDQGLDRDVAEWDSWRRDDGRWAVTVTPPGGTPACYVFDVAGRFSVADDDVARSLVGDEQPTEDPEQMAIASAVAEGTQTPPVGLPVDRGDDPGDDTATGASAMVSRLRRRRPVSAVPDPLPLEPADEAVESANGDPGSAMDQSSAASTPAQRPARKRGERRRASVPSWDEIMFGGKSSDS